MKVIYQFCILLFSGFIFLTCDKTRIDDNQEWQFADETRANIKIINAYTSAIPAPPVGIAAQRFLIFQNGVKLNGSGLTSGSFWPSANSYASVEAGQSNIRLMNDRLIAGVLGAPVAGDTIININTNLVAGKYYSMFLVGAAPKQEMVVVEDDITQAIDTGNIKIRLANMTSDPARPLRIFSKRYNRDLISGVNYKGVSNFVTLPLQYSGLTDTLDLYAVGSTTKLTSLVAFSSTSKYTYTFYTHGKTGFRTEALGVYQR